MTDETMTGQEPEPKHRKTITTSRGRHTFIVMPSGEVPSSDEMLERANAIDDLILRFRAPLFSRRQKSPS
jgi:hypothetical protein